MPQSYKARFTRLFLGRSQPYLNVSIGHSNIVGICLQVFRSSHDSKLYGPFVAERLVSPFSDGSNLFHGGNAVIGNKYLVDTSQRTTHNGYGRFWKVGSY